MHKSDIVLSVMLDEDKMPEKIFWKAEDSNEKDEKEAKAMMLSLWDGHEKTAMRIDLWTKAMMVDEMNDMYFQTMMTMADSYVRSTGDEELSKELKEFAAAFYKKAQSKIK